MKTFRSAYDFYKLPEQKRIELIGHVFKEGEAGAIYFPILLSGGEFNYGVQQGLIRVSQLLHTGTNGDWFRVSAFSPDDLDRDLDFDNPPYWLHRAVVKYVEQMNKRGRTYCDFLAEIQAHFGLGERTS